MQDLRSLRRSCKWMCQVCKSRHVAKSIPLQHTLERELYAVPHYDRDYRNDLIGKLAEVGNEEACASSSMCTEASWTALLTI
ncbi:unnamed protein product [Urochloa humidicola]